MSDWQPIETAPEFRTVLTQHKDDLYPVSAFKLPGEWCEAPDGVWYLEREGPEDTDDRRPGRYSELYRTPTHWMELPDSPLVEAEATALRGEK